jgi:hypothetical protein
MKHPLRDMWLGIRYRCYDPTCADWHRYGGRGIGMCAEWRDNFDQFLQDIGPRPSPEHSLDRIDVDGDYTPTNCRWADRAQQNTNRSTTIKLTYQGRTQCLKHWAKEFGICYSAAHARYKKGKSLNEVFLIKEQ